MEPRSAGKSLKYTLFSLCTCMCSILWYHTNGWRGYAIGPLLAYLFVMFAEDILKDGIKIGIGKITDDKSKTEHKQY